MGSSLMALPRLVSSELAQTSDPFEVEKILADEIRRVCERMYEGFSAMAARAKAEHDAEDNDVDAFAHLFEERRSTVPEAGPCSTSPTRSSGRLPTSATISSRSDERRVGQRCDRAC